MLHMKRGILEVLLVDAHGIAHTNFIGDYKITKTFFKCCCLSKYIKLKDPYFESLVRRKSCVLCVVTMWDKGIP